MTPYHANIHITLKPVVNDPPGLAIRDGLHNLGYTAVETVRSGKYLQVYLTAESEDAARAQIDSRCQRLLANPVIEDYSFTLQKTEPAEA
jgi:phosphoribosylformylglycinamidine synthase PurS subunit